MFVISNIVGSTIQITTLPLPVLSTLQASGLVFNTAFATILLHEPFTRYSLIGTILTCAGAALIAVFGAISEPAHGLQQLLDLLVQPQFVTWMAGTFVVVILTIIGSHFLKIYSLHHAHQAQKHRRSSGSARRRSSVGNAMARSFTATLPPAMQVRSHRMRFLRGLCYALVSGILSAHSLLVAKSAVELLVRTIVDGNNQFNRWQSWAILLALLAFALGQLYYLHLGLRLCSTSVLYPFVFCVYNIIAILDGLIYFRQGSRLSGLHAGLIALGTVVLLAGVLALSWRLDDSAPIDHTASQSTAIPSSAIAPGMSIMPTARQDLDEISPLLPTSRPNTSGSKQRPSESSPLLHHRPIRKPTLSIWPPPPETDRRSILAELADDSEPDGDYLASLPRTPSPFLLHSTVKPRRRTRGSSLSSVGPWAAHPNTSGSTISFQKKRSQSRLSSESEEPIAPDQKVRRANTQVDDPFKERRRSSAPGLTASGRRRGTDTAVSPLAATQDGQVRSMRASQATTQREDEGNEDIALGERGIRSRRSSTIPSRYDLSEKESKLSARSGTDANGHRDGADPGG